jgi:hypothetical protein
MIPELGKYYYVDYKDNTNPKGSYCGIALCVNKYEYDEAGNKLNPVMYEFKHSQEGKNVLSLFVEKEILLKAV